MRKQFDANEDLEDLPDSCRKHSPTVHSQLCSHLSKPTSDTNVTEGHTAGNVQRQEHQIHVPENSLLPLQTHLRHVIAQLAFVTNGRNLEVFISRASFSDFRTAPFPSLPHIWYRDGHHEDRLRPLRRGGEPALRRLQSDALLHAGVPAGRLVCEYAFGRGG